MIDGAGLVSGVTISSTYIATFSGIIKGKTYGMMFMFIDEDETYYYNHNCYTEVKACHDYCQTCSPI